MMLFWILFSIQPEKQVPKKEEKKIKISLKELPKKYKKSGLTKEKIPEPKIAPPMPKGSQLEKIEKKPPPIKFEPKKEPLKTKLNKPKTTQKAKQEIEKIVKKVKPLPPTEPYIPLEKTKTADKKAVEEKKDPLYSLLSQDHSDEEENKEKEQVKSGSSISSNVKELYGDEFGKLSPGQQKYILDNQEIMRRITQQVLNRVARVNIPHDLNVNRVNVIEFYLHPNGDMTDFKFLQKSNYYILDETTKETIEYAYSRYPRPSEKTLIRYNVFYNLARY
jgi:hypothetical protein